MCPVIKNGSGETSATVGKRTALNIANFTEQAKAIILRARADADEILAAARAEAEAIRAEAEAHLRSTRDEAEVLKQQAHETGHAEGREEGYRDGQADGAEKAFDEAIERFDTQCAQLKDLFRSAVMQLDEAREDILREARAEMLQFAMEIAHRITGLQAAGDLEVARKILSRVLGSAPCAGRLKLRVNNEQLDQLKVYAEEYISAISSETAIDVTGDEDLAPGDVVLQSPAGGVDGRVGIQFDNIARAITGMDYAPMTFDDLPETDERDAEAGKTLAAQPEDHATDDSADASPGDAPDGEAFDAQGNDVERLIDQTGRLVDRLTGELKRTGSLDDDSDERPEARTGSESRPETQPATGSPGGDSEGGS